MQKNITDFEHPTLQSVSFLLNSTQGVALGYGIHWAFSPSILNPKVEYSRTQYAVFKQLGALD